jgi:hypothetical protein
MKLYYTIYCALILSLLSCSNGNFDDKKYSLEWNFDSFDSLVYSYSTFDKSETSFNVEGRSLLQNIDNQSFGELKVIPIDTNRANVTMVTLKSIDRNEDGKSDTSYAQTGGTVEGMNQNGDFIENEADNKFTMFFPIPPREIGIGDRVSKKVKMIFRTNGKKAFLYGKINLRFKEIIEINELPIALLVGKINISRLEVPKGVKGSFTRSVKGNAKYYFNLKDQYFTKVEIDYDSKMSMKIPKGYWQSDRINSKGKSTIKIEIKE